MKRNVNVFNQFFFLFNENFFDFMTDPRPRKLQIWLWRWGIDRSRLHWLKVLIEPKFELIWNNFFLKLKRKF